MRPGGEDGVDAIMLAVWLAAEIRDLNAELERDPGAAMEPSTRERGIRAVAEAERLDRLSREGLSDCLTSTVGMAPEAAGRLLGEIEDIRAHGVRLAAAMGQGGRERASDAVRAVRESPASRSALRGTSGDFSELGEFAPILRFVSEVGSPSVKAEMTAKAELYIRSGWAARDMAGGSGAAERLREVVTEAAKGGNPAGAVGALQARFSELFSDIRVTTVRGASNEPSYRASSGSSDTGGTAGSGRVDAVIHDAEDPSLIHVAMVTADPSTFIEGNQILRHRAAVVASMEAGELGAAKRAHFSFYAPCLFYDSAELGRIGSRVSSQIEGGLSPSERAALNLVPFLSVTARFSPDYGGFSVGDMSDIELRLIGAGSGLWNENASRIATDGADRDARTVEVCAGVVATALRTLSRIRDDIPRMATDSAAGETLVNSLAEAWAGVTEHGLTRPDSLRPLEEALPEARMLFDRLQRSNGARNRMAPVLSLYEAPGGIRASAALRLSTGPEAERARNERVGEVLLEACARGDRNLAKRMIDIGADVLRTGKNGMTAHDAAVLSGDGVLAGYMAFKRDAALAREAMGATRGVSQRRPPRGEGKGAQCG